MKFLIVKLILFLGQRTFFGRGKIRKILVDLINFLIPSNNSLKTRFICYIKNVPFNFYNDDLTGIKIYFGRNQVGLLLGKSI